MAEVVSPRRRPIRFLTFIVAVAAFSLAIVGLTSGPAGAAEALACDAVNVFGTFEGTPIDSHSMTAGGLQPGLQCGELATLALSDGAWSATLTTTVDEHGEASFNGTATDAVHTLPTGSTSVFYTVTGAVTGLAGEGNFGINVATPPPPPPPTCGTFNDVTASNLFCPDILWLVDKSITTGYPDGGYHPTAAVGRQEMAAFLYRFANPGVTPAACTTAAFPDVPTTSLFCPQIKWLAAQHISEGYPDGGFHPAAPVTRQEMAAFMFRLTGSDVFPLCSVAPFNDVAVSSPFCGYITWLVDNHITTGYLDGGFHPRATVHRQEMAAFLHRLYALIHPA